jgi:hypothetical protein
MPTLLLNWLFYEPVGHLVEALQHAHGYWRANAERFELHLFLNAATPIELAEALPWLTRVYPLDPAELAERGAAAGCLRGVPSRFDYVISDPRTAPGVFVEGWDEAPLVRAQALLHALYPADEYSKGWGDFHGLPAPAPAGLPYQRDARLSLPLPDDARRFAATRVRARPTLCVLLGGGGGALRSPTPSAWLAILRALQDALPGAHLLVTGVSARVNGRSFTRDWPPAAAAALCRELPRAELAYDVGLWNQLALIERCALFVSPHTGFGFLPQLVGTPWLALSSCPWPEYVLNGVPFYSALPDCDSYPSETRVERGCGRRLRDGLRPACTEDRSFAARLDDIRRGAALLVDPRFDFASGRSLHARKLRALARTP